jgi:hypothetical protein
MSEVSSVDGIFADSWPQTSDETLCGAQVGSTLAAAIEEA